MTQFLLAAFENVDLPPAYAVTAAVDPHFAGAAESIFGTGSSVMKIAPLGDEMDDLVDRARDEILAGAEIGSTELGRLLAELARQGEFALYWSSYFDDLPSVATIAELWQLIQPQILEARGNWELYVHFVPTRVV